MDETSSLFPGSSSIQAGQRTSARAAMIKLLDMTARGEKGVGVTLRELLSKQELKFLLEGGGGTKGDPLVLFNKYFGEDVAKHLPLDASPQTINAFTRKLMRMKDRGGNWFDEAGFDPEKPVFAEGGLADILQVSRKGYGDGLKVDNFIGPVQEQEVVQPSFSPYKSRAQLIAESGFQNKSLLDTLSEKSRIGSDKVGLKLSPSAELNVSKSSEGNYDIKNKNIWMRLSSILNLGPFSADIDYSKIKDKIKVKSKKEGATVFKDAWDDERLAYKLGYAKDGLNMDVRTNKDLNNLQFSLKKTFMNEPERIFAKKAKGGLAKILEV